MTRTLPILLSLTIVLSSFSGCSSTKPVVADAAVDVADVVCDVAINMKHLPAGLAGKWVFKAYTATDLSKAKCKPDEVRQMTIEFKEEGRLEGTSSCNSYFGVYRQGRESLTFEELSFSEKLCGESESTVMTWEQHLKKGLRGTYQYKLVGNSLRLQTNNGADLFFLLAAE